MRKSSFFSLFITLCAILITTGCQREVDGNLPSISLPTTEETAIATVNGRIVDDDSLNATEINDFSQLIDKILSKNMRITTLSEIVDLDN